jgi:hypothetical protein
MKYDNEELRYFIPQRILNKKPLTISGVDLYNELKTVKIYSKQTSEDVLNIKQELLTNNTRENINFLISFSDLNKSSFLIEANEDKILFCKSFVHDGCVNILKTEHKKVFEGNKIESMNAYINDYLSESPHASISHAIFCENEGNKYLIKSKEDADELKSGLFEYITYPCLVINKIGLENYAQLSDSIVILTGTKIINCSERIIVNESDNNNVNNLIQNEKPQDEIIGFKRFLADTDNIK